jgi:AcrR family transcriptional regulator
MAAKSSRGGPDVAPDVDTNEDIQDEGDLGAVGPRLSGPWRERVVGRALGPATKRTLDQADALLRAATSILEKEGENLTVQDVADQAGYSLRVLYRHFEGKDDLLLAVLEESLRLGAENIDSLLRDVSDPVEKIRSFIIAAVDKPRTSFNLALAKHEVALSSSRADEVAIAQQPMVALARELIQNAIDAGRIPAQDAGEAAYLILATKRAFNLSSLLGNELGAPMPSVDGLASFCLRGLGVSDG